MSVIKSGVVSENSASSIELGNAVTERVPTEINVTTIVGNILNEFSDAAVIMIAPGQGRIIASSAAARRAEINAKIAAAASVLDISPDAGQTGRSLTFSPVAGNNLAGIDIADLHTAVKPKFTVESVVARLLAKIQEREAAVPADANKFAIVVDQVNKKIGLRKYAADLDIEETLTATGDADTVALSLEPDATTPTSSPLPFEGGAV